MMNLKAAFTLALAISGSAFSQDFGVWREISLPPSAIQWATVDFSDSLHGALFSENGHFLITSDAGISWKLDSLSVLGKVAAERYLAPDTFWVANGEITIPEPLISYLTFNGGKSWIERTVPDSLRIGLAQHLAIPDIHTLFAVEWAAFFKSSDAGINWTSIPISSRYHPSSIYFTDTLHGSITFSAGGAPFSGGYILTTFDGGVSWDTSGSADHYFVYYFTPKLGYALGAIELDDISFPFTRVTADGGKSWSDAGQHTFAAAKYENGNLLAFNNFTKLSKKSDSLFSIVQDYMGLIDQRIIAFETVSEHQGWLLTSDGKLFSQTDIQTSVHGLNCSQKITTELDFLNSPSLFRSSTTIRYRLPHSGVVHLDIFDIVGRKVGVLANEYSVEGIHEATWHAEHYASGIYFCRLTSGDRSKTIKLILRK